MEKFVDELTWRGLIKDITPGLEQLSGNFSGYVGVDPTASSMHIGHLTAIMMLKHLQVAGFRPIILVGGFTGQIGDPSGKKSERQILDTSVVENNVKALTKQFEKFLDFDCGDTSAKIVNNVDWLGQMNLTDFFRNVGKSVTVNEMLSKDAVQSRIGTGISYTEFSYQLFQSFDFVHLFDKENCILQMGGSDQWGNILGGIDLIRKNSGQKAFGITCPLLTKSDGNKFGKSEGGNIWLDAELTSPFKFYQFWLNVEDDQVGKLLRIFTVLSEEQIVRLEKSDINIQKRDLALFITRMVHGDEAALNAIQASNLLFGKASLQEFQQTDAGMLREVFETIPYITRLGSIQNVFEIISSLFSVSKSEARRLIEAGGIKVNCEKMSLDSIWFETRIHDKFILFQKGKQFGVVEIS